MTKKLQELIEEWQEVPMDCSGSPFFRGDKPQRLEFAKAIAQLAEEEGEKKALSKFIDVYSLANERTPSIANQGQRLDGYSELANYRYIIQKLLSNQKEDV